MKIIFITLVYSFFSATVSAQKGANIAVAKKTSGEQNFRRGMLNGRRSLTLNDKCSNAQLLNVGDIVRGNTLQIAPESGHPRCFGTSGGLNPSNGVWYKVVGTGCSLIADARGSSVLTQILVYYGSCDSLSCLEAYPTDTWNDDLTDKVVWGTRQGQEYFIFVGSDGASNNRLEFQLSISEGPCAPGNDDVCFAEPMTISTPTVYNSFAATVEAGEVKPFAPCTLVPDPEYCGASDTQGKSQGGWCDCQTAGAQNSVWFMFNPDADGCFDVYTDNEDDLQLALWQAEDCSDYSTFTLVEADDDSGERNAPRIFNARLNAGEQYYIQLDGFLGLKSSGQLMIGESNDVIKPVVECKAVGSHERELEREETERENYGSTNYGKFELVGGDDCSDVLITVQDSVSGQKFGPYPSGTVIKYVKRPDTTPSVRPSEYGDAQYIIKGRGDAILWGVDKSGNQADPAGCPLLGTNGYHD